MKLPLIIVFSFLLICSIGCVTKPLSIGEHGWQLAGPLELELADIKFLNYCGYRIIPITQSKNFTPNPGIIAATNTDRSIATGNLRSVGKKEVIKFSMDEIDGFDEIGNQLQITFDDQLLVLFIYSMYPFEIDYGREKELVDLLNRNAVPRYEAEFAFNKRRRSTHPFDYLDALLITMRAPSVIHGSIHTRPRTEVLTTPEATLVRLLKMPREIKGSLLVAGFCPS